MIDKRPAFIFLVFFQALQLGASPLSTFQTVGSVLKGTVIDHLRGESPVAGAEVTIPDLRIGTLTTSAGDFSFYNLPKGTYLIQVRLLGYQAVSQTITLPEANAVRFSLSPSSVETGEIVVTGVGKAAEIRRSPVPTVVLNKHYLFQQAASTNVIDAIARVPGISAVTTGPNVSKPFIRGLGYNRIVTLVDGIRQEGQQWGDEHGIEVDQNAIDRVEIIKGPASLSYGSDAIAGVINLLPPIPVAESTIAGSLTGNHQSNNGFWGSSVRVQGNQKGLVWMGIFSQKLAKNYTNSNDGRVYGTAFNEKDGRIMVGLSRPWGYSYLNGSVFDDNQEIPDGSRDTLTNRFTKQITEADLIRPVVADKELNNYAIKSTHQLVQHYRIYNNSSFHLGNGELLTNLAYQYSHRREFSHPTAPEVPGLNLQLHTFNYDVKYSLTAGKDLQTTYGINGMFQKNSIAGSTNFVIPNYNQFDFGAFGLIKKDIGAFTISGGLRFDTRTYNEQTTYVQAVPYGAVDTFIRISSVLNEAPIFTSFRQTYKGVSGSLGVSYLLAEKLTIKANIARGYRAPNVAEISDNGVHPGTSSYQIGNDNFKPEFNLQEDIGLSLSTRYVSAGVEVFNNSITNFIYNAKLQASTGKDSARQGFPVFKFLQTKAAITGGEASIDIHPLPWLHFLNTVTFTFGENKNATADTAKYLPFIPPVHTLSELRADLPSYPFLKGFYVSLGLEHYGKQNKFYGVNNTETETAGYNLLNAGLGGNLTNRNGRMLFSIFIQGTNLADVAYQSHLSRLKYFGPNATTAYPRSGIFNMGRNVSIKVNIPFDVR